MSDKRHYEPFALKVHMLETSVGTPFVYLVWALKPLESRLVAACTDEQKAQRYVDNPPRKFFDGFKLMIERAPLDHAFGFADLQSWIHKDDRK